MLSDGLYRRGGEVAGGVDDEDKGFSMDMVFGRRKDEEGAVREKEAAGRRAIGGRKAG